MAAPLTEARHQAADGLDARADQDILAVLLAGQTAALASLNSSIDQIAKGAALMAQTIDAGGALIYAAAGSSGLMALADAAELGGTFGIGADRIRILMAGGLPVDARLPGGTEDDIDEGTRAAEIVQPDDTVIVLSARGTTPYALAIAQAGRERGAAIIGIANNPGAALFDHANVAITLPTPPEVIAGSTRMGAGTAQKAALNMMSTLMGVKLGHIYDGMMVNVVADNTKLRARAERMVARIAGVSQTQASACLTRTNSAVKPAVLLAAGASPADVDQILAETKGHLRAALARV